MKFRSCLALCVLLLGSLGYAQGPAAPYTVNLGWTLSVSSNVTGQNVYRAIYAQPSGPCGSYTSLTATALASTITSYADTTVANGTAYCYGVTAVGPTGESGLSNIVSNVKIPPSPPTNLTNSVS